MNIVVMIQGREAIPVRAVAFATNWGTLAPGHLAGVLAHTDEIESCYDGFAAYHIEDGRILQIRANWWDEASREIERLYEELRARRNEGKLTQEENHRRWREEPLRRLPPGVFVWKDELESRHLTRGAARYGEAGMPKAAAEEFARTALDFDPFIEQPELRALIAEAIATLKTPMSAGSKPNPESAPTSAEHGVRVWTDERKAEVRAYRATHGLKKTAEHYGVSQATISKHIPAGKKKKASGPWGGLPKD